MNPHSFLEKDKLENDYNRHKQYYKILQKSNNSGMNNYTNLNSYNNMK
jgi:hypothetical protein